MSSTTPRQLTAEEKKLEKLLLHEQKAEAKAIDHTLKDLKHAEKAEVKAEKSVDKAVHSHEKAVRKEHDASKALNKAIHKHEDTVSAEKSLAQNVEIKAQHQSKLEQEVALKKQQLEQLEQRKAHGDQIREAKLNALHSEPGSTTSATGPSAANPTGTL